MKTTGIFRLIALLTLFFHLPASPQPGQAASQVGNLAGKIYLPYITTHISHATGSLANGGVFEGEGGVGLGALDTSLTHPITVTIAQTTAPTLTLPAGAQPVSGYIQVSASPAVSLTTEAPLILAFPIPAGVVTTTLALAVYKASLGVNDAAGKPPAWSFLEGRVDAAHGRFLTTLASLPAAGETIALASQPGFSSPASQPVPAGARPGGDRPGGIQFNLICTGFPYPADPCTPALLTEVSGYLSNIYQHIYQDLGFHLPRLRNLGETISYNPNSLSFLGYTAYVEPWDSGWCTDVGGYYDPDEGRLVWCLNPAVGIDPNTFYYLTHEYFHATEYGYPNIMTEGLLHLDEDWTVEGLATAAMQSFWETSMARYTGYSELHKVDVSLKSDGLMDAYHTQDFWVWYGLHTGQALPYLDKVLKGGVMATDVARTLGSGDLLDPYWDWEKNQAMEATIDLGGALTSPCKLEEALVLSPTQFDFVWNVPFLDVTVGPLSTAVVDVQWDQAYSGAYGQVFPPLGQPAKAKDALRYKMYENGENNCQGVPDGSRVYIHPDPAKIYYVLVSNLSPTETYTYRVGFEVTFLP